METINQQQVLQAFEKLLGHVSPEELHQSIENMFFDYLSKRDIVYPPNDIVWHMYLLLLFLREVEG